MPMGVETGNSLNVSASACPATPPTAHNKTIPTSSPRRYRFGMCSPFGRLAVRRPRQVPLRHTRFPSFDDGELDPNSSLPRAAERDARPHQSALAPWIDQIVGTFPTPADCVTCVPFTNQIATLPLVSCQRMSLLPSLL